MIRFSYLGVLGFCFVGTVWLEFLLRTRVYRRALRLVLVLIPIMLAFSVWDIYAIAQGHWDFDAERTTGVLLPFDLPLDELLFFVMIPTASILTLEAVRSVKGWDAGDGA